MLARKSDLWPARGLELAALVRDLAEERAFWIASADCVAKVRRSSTVPAGTVRRLAVDEQPAEKMILAQQRDGEQRSASRRE
jgi:hypothetical protein